MAFGMTMEFHPLANLFPMIERREARAMAVA
jgi:hypothetical protein